MDGSSDLELGRSNPPQHFLMDKRSTWGPRVYLQRISDAQLIEECRRRGWTIQLPVLTIPGLDGKTSLNRMDADDFRAYVKLRCGKTFRELTKKERQFIEAMLQSYPRTARAEYLIDYLYGDDPSGGPSEAPESIRVYACKLRRALEDVPVFLETVWGYGYKLDINQLLAPGESPPVGQQGTSLSP